jgi:hypothetical protein
MSAPTAAFTHQPVYSPWFGLATQPPWEPGVYEVDGPGLGSGPLFSLWDGCAFGILARSREAAAEARGADGCADGIAFWRGIVPPSRLPRFVSETWAEARSRVPALVEFDGEPVAPNIANVCHLLDCKPGYELHQLLHLPGGPDVILYRRRDHS